MYGEPWRELLRAVEDAKKDVSDAFNNGFSQEVVNLREKKLKTLEKEMRNQWAKAHGLK